MVRTFIRKTESYKILKDTKASDKSMTFTCKYFDKISHQCCSLLCMPTCHDHISFWQFCMQFSLLGEFVCGFAILNDFFFGFVVSNIPNAPLS